GGHVLVDRAGGGALGIELGIVLVGLDQGLVHGAGACSGANQTSVGGRLGRERRDPKGRRRGYGKRCNLCSTRNRPSPPTIPQHAPPRPATHARVANLTGNWAVRF